MQYLAIIDKYLNILNEQLISFGLKNNEKIILNIKMQMLSILKHWNDLNLRNIILLFGREEAQYYLPKANMDIKAFVVVAIRNSLIETAGSQFYKENGFEIQLDDDKHIPLITKKAILYFKDFDFSRLGIELSTVEIDDCYYNVIKQFPLTYQILYKLVTTKKLELHFEKVQCDTVNVNFDINETFSDKDQYVIEDGYSNKFNKVLINTLEEIIEQKGNCFFADSFKYVSRNFEKNLKVIEYLLQNDCCFVTFNYFISNGFVSKRKELLKPTHKRNDLSLKFQKMNGISNRHKRVIEMYK